MYGNKPPAARRLAQPPQKYADGGMVARMKSADAGPATFGSRGLSQLRDMIPKMQAMGYPQQAAPAAADPRAAQLQAMIPQMEAMGYKQQPQRLADGGFVSAAKRMMGLTPEDPAQAARLAEYKANAAREKAAAKMATPPAPAPQAAITQYTGMSATERRMKEQGLADGGMIRGPGTGTSDSIATEAEPGTFIMPADSTKAIGPKVLAQMGKKVPVRLSNGEYELPPEQVMGIGAAVLEALKDSTHEAAELQEEGGEEQMGMAAQKLAGGGMVSDTEEPQSDYARQMRAMGGALVDGASWVGKTLVSAPGYGLNKTPAPAPAPAAASRLAAAPTPGAGRGMVSPPAVNPSAPRPVAPPPAPSLASAATALSSGVPSAQADNAATSLSRRGAADALAQMPNAPPPVSAPVVRNSTNDWAARKALENAATAASSITANGGEWDKSGPGDSQAQAAYKAALATDQTLQNAQPGLDAEAMRQNASLQRETIQQQGSTARDAERNAISRDELGLRKTAAGFQNRAAARMENLGNVLLDPNATPEQRKVAQRSLVALSGKSAADRMQVVNLPDTTNEQGAVVRGGQALVRTLEDGTVEQVPIGGQGGAKQPLESNQQAIAIRDNKSLSREQKVEALRKLGY